MVFEFKCNRCDRLANMLGPIGQTPDTPPRCDCGGSYKRVYKKLGVNYRCSGFYTTDKVLSDPVDELD